MKRKTKEIGRHLFTFSNRLYKRHFAAVMDVSITPIYIYSIGEKSPHNNRKKKKINLFI
jgi:hypothetical protein